MEVKTISLILHVSVRELFTKKLCANEPDES